MSDDAETRRWYVRRSTTVQGPFPAESIRRYLLLGRLRLSDRVSVDGSAWEAITRRPELIPDGMRDLGSAAGRARFEQARRAVDERSTEREGAAAPADADRPPSATATPAPRSRRRRRPGLALGAFGGLLCLAVALAAVGYYRDFEQDGARPADCDATGARVWNGCVKDGLELEPGAALVDLQAINASLRNARLVAARLVGARLDFADLTGAKLARADLAEAVLRGADLRAADLRGADLRAADLRNADLRRARLDGVRLDGARLGNALWIDGRACADGSVGACD